MQPDPVPSLRLLLGWYAVSRLAVVVGADAFARWLATLADVPWPMCRGRWVWPLRWRRAGRR